MIPVHERAMRHRNSHVNETLKSETETLIGETETFFETLASWHVQLDCYISITDTLSIFASRKFF